MDEAGAGGKTDISNARMPKAVFLTAFKIYKELAIVSLNFFVTFDHF